MPERAAIRRPADTLAELQAMLPPGLVQSPRQPIDPPEVMEIWFSPQQPSQLAGRCSGLLGRSLTPAPTSPADTATLSHASTIPGMDHRLE